MILLLFFQTCLKVCVSGVQVLERSLCSCALLGSELLFFLSIIADKFVFTCG